MVRTKYSLIPDYLHASEFYQSLDCDSPDEFIEVPDSCFRASDDAIDSLEDLVHLFRVLLFWGIKVIPHSLMEFCFSHNIDEWESVLKSTFEEGLSELMYPMTVFKRPEKFSLQMAIDAENPEIIEFWICKNSPSSAHGLNGIAQACRFGRQDLVATLREQGYTWNEWACCAAAQYGHLSLLQYLHEQGCPWDWRALVFAARVVQLRCMQYLHTHGCPWDERVTMEFSGYYYDHYARYFEYPPWFDDDPLVIPKDGYINCLRYALDNGCPISKRACEVVVHFNHLSCLLLLHQRGAHWDAAVTCAAASTGNLDCLTYLHDHSCPWDEGALTFAAGEDHFACLCYALENGCDHHDRSLEEAAQYDHVRALKYVIEGHGWYINENGNIFAEAFCRAHIDCVRYLIDVGCPIQNYVFTKASYIDRRADGNFLECIVTAVQHGWRWNKALLDFINMPADDDPLNFEFPLCQAYAQSEGWNDETL